MKYITEGYQGSMFFWLNNHDGMMAFPLDHEEKLPVKTQHARKRSSEGLPPECFDLTSTEEHPMLQQHR